MTTFYFHLKIQYTKFAKSQLMNGS